MSSVEAVDSFLAEHGSALGRLAHHLTGDRDAALDLVQETLLRLLPRWHRVQGAESSLAYVRRALVNQHLNTVRRPQPVPVAQVPDASVRRTGAGPGAPAEPAYDDLDAMWRALAELSERQRAVLVLRYYEGCTDPEIAGLLGCRRATVRSLAARGLERLRSSPHLADQDRHRLDQLDDVDDHGRVS